MLFAPLHRCSPFIGGLRYQAIQMEHGPYRAEGAQKAVYIVRCLWVYSKANERTFSFYLMKNIFFRSDLLQITVARDYLFE
jgi:hypothetical protein